MNRSQHAFLLNPNGVLDFSIKQEGLFLHLHQNLMFGLLDSPSQEISILLRKKRSSRGEATCLGLLVSGAARTPTQTSNSKVYPERALLMSCFLSPPCPCTCCPSASLANFYSSFKTQLWVTCHLCKAATTASL